METKDTDWKSQVQRIADNVRMRVFEHIIQNKGGYLSQTCSSAETLSLLYGKIMNLGPSQASLKSLLFGGVPHPDNPDFFNGGAYNGPKAPHLDRFIFSPAHYALVLYTVLIEVGRLDPQGLDKFNQDGSTVEMIGAEHSPGIETTTGSLAQAISQAGGIALARQRKGDTGRVWVYMSDGELQEGQTWEAIQAMAWYRLDNVGIFVDVNCQQCDGRMVDVMDIGPIGRKVEAFGARVFQADGHDLEALYHPTTLEPDGRPLVVLAHTNPTQSMPFLKERAPKLHTVKFASVEQHTRYHLAYRIMKRMHDAKQLNMDVPHFEVHAALLDRMVADAHEMQQISQEATALQVAQLTDKQLNTLILKAAQQEER